MITYFRTAPVHTIVRSGRVACPEEDAPKLHAEQQDSRRTITATLISSTPNASQYSASLRSYSRLHETNQGPFGPHGWHRCPMHSHSKEVIRFFGCHFRGRTSIFDQLESFHCTFVSESQNCSPLFSKQISSPTAIGWRRPVVCCHNLNCSAAQLSVAFLLPRPQLVSTPVLFAC